MEGGCEADLLATGSQPPTPAHQSATYTISFRSRVALNAANFFLAEIAVVLVAQVVMIPVALAAGWLCDSWGPKWVFGIGLVALPVRIFLYTLTQDPWMLVALQALDGIGAGVYGVVIVAICADLTKGKGGFNALFGMMIVVGVLRLSGFFERLVDMALRRIATPKGLLAVMICLSGVLSAFLINDVVCVALTPLVLRLARRLGFDPIPHLIGLAGAGDVKHLRRQSHHPRLGGQPHRCRDARREDVTISFWEYCKVGIPLTILTLALGIAWLQFVHY